MGRSYDLGLALGALAGWENAWGRLCSESRPQLRQVRGTQPFGGCESACQALRLDGLNAWLTVWTALVAAPGEDCPLCALGQAPWGLAEVRRLVRGCAERPGAAAEVATLFRQGEEAEAAARLEIEAVRRLTAPGLSSAHPYHSWLTVRDIASHFKLPPRALRGRLERFREDNAQGWRMVERTGPRQPTYQYLVSAVWHILKDLRADV
jgi:hypothetical protein